MSYFMCWGVISKSFFNDFCTNSKKYITWADKKLDHLGINSTTAVAGKAGFTITLAAIAVVDFMATWLNLYPLTVRIVKRKRNVFWPDLADRRTLKVHGVKQLRVIDASVMPRVVGGNTNAATIMIGEKGADIILKDWLRQKKLRESKVKDELW